MQHRRFLIARLEGTELPHRCGYFHNLYFKRLMIMKIRSTPTTPSKMNTVRRSCDSKCFDATLWTITCLDSCRLSWQLRHIFWPMKVTMPASRTLRLQRGQETLP